MAEREWLGDRFESERTRLRSVAYRMLGSMSEADDAVQETWLRLNRADTTQVENLSGWLTTVTARVCLDMLRSRKARREEPLEANHASPVDPEREAILAEGIGLAMLVVLETLEPAERVAFVLHDMFAVPFIDIAPIVGRTPTAARQLASRGRRRVQGRPAPAGLDRIRQQQIVKAFLAASRGGDFGALIALLDPNVVALAGPQAAKIGAATEVRGAREVAAMFAGRARAAELALIDGAPGLVWIQRGRLRVVFGFTIANGKITGIELIADPDRIERLRVEVIREG